ncbi:hypothetical protein N181_02670 [Sinorhizobium fredii USDA 205]|nr:hypothetical protein N181_02670 [Sinorhizobium fredii USDA 205]
MFKRSAGADGTGALKGSQIASAVFKYKIYQKPR